MNHRKEAEQIVVSPLMLSGRVRLVKTSDIRLARRLPLALTHMATSLPAFAIVQPFCHRTLTCRPSYPDVVRYVWFGSAYSPTPIYILGHGERESPVVYFVVVWTPLAQPL